MAPIKPLPKAQDLSSTPLADYFWIAGLDGQDLLDTYIKLGEVNSPNTTNGNDFNNTIVEDEAAESGGQRSPESPRPSSKQSKRNSYQRLSRLSSEAQISIRSLDKLPSGNSSARSSATIKAIPAVNSRTSVLLSDLDFEKALKKFATERDSFLLDINFSAGAVTQTSRPRPKQRAQKIVAEEQNNGLSRGMGSVRRHISFREMNSVKRQSSVARQGGLPYVPFKIHPNQTCR